MRGRPGGSNAIIKLAYGDVEGMVLKENSVVGISVPLDRSARDSLKSTIKAAKEYMEAVDAYPALKAKDPKAASPKMPKGAEPILKVLKGKASLWVSPGGGGFNPFRRMMGGSVNASDVASIREALEISKMFGKGVVIHPAGFGDKGVAVIANVGNRPAKGRQAQAPIGANQI